MMGEMIIAMRMHILMASQVQIDHRLQDHRRPAPASSLPHQRSVVGYFAKSCASTWYAILWQKATTLADSRVHMALL